MIKLMPFFLLFHLNSSQACVSEGKTPLTKAQRAHFTAKKRRPSAVSPDFPSTILEGQLGNLLLQYKDKKSVISIPASLQKSDYHPFGDGQSNAKMSFGPYWKENGFPAVGIQTSDGKRNYQFHASLKIKDYKETDLGNKWFKVQPSGWEDSFYFCFDTSTYSVKTFLSGIPEKLRTFSQNRIAPDPARIGKSSPAENVMKKDLGPGYNKEPWYNDNVHGLFPNEKGEKTALGGVITRGIATENKNDGPFKQLYTCFETRNMQKEKALGIPSGAGWHHIGNAAETLLNDLENASLPVAIGRDYKTEHQAYGLGQSITATWLESDQAFVTAQNEFHWYLNPYEKPVCTEIWVHNCVPGLNNNWGFNCQ